MVVSFGTKVTDNCEQSYVLGAKPRSLHQQPAFITPEPSLQSPRFDVVQAGL